MGERLFIDAETVVIGLLLERQSYYVDLEQIEKFCSYIKCEVLNGTRFAEYRAVFMDADHSAIARLSQYKRYMYDLTEERIYLKVPQDEILSLANTNPQIRQAIHDFVVGKEV